MFPLPVRFLNLIMMTIKNPERILLFFVVLMLGCSPALKITAFPMVGVPTVDATTRQTAPTVVGLSTPAIQGLVTQTLVATPTTTNTPIVLTINPTYLNFATVTPTSTVDPNQFLLKIVSPGPMSKLVSPVEFIVQIAPGYTGTTRIEMIGEDGVELYRKVYRTFSNIGFYTRVDEKINFEIQGTAEVARLQVSTFDAFGRIQAYNSVRILLQTVGENQFTPATETKDRLLLRNPAADDEIGGNSLIVTGEFLPVNNLPIIMELIDEKGVVIGSRILQLNGSLVGYQQFSTNIPFQIDKKTPVRLEIHQSDDRINGLAYLFSRLVTLSPK